jgi:ferrous iron transport protein A
MALKRDMRLTEMRIGQKGTITKIAGGTGSLAKLEALGIRIGAEVVKKSALIARGPVIVAIGGTEIAMGYGMAQKIRVEVDEREDIAYRQS